MPPEDALLETKNRREPAEDSIPFLGERISLPKPDLFEFSFQLIAQIKMHR